MITDMIRGCWPWNQIKLWNLKATLSGLLAFYVIAKLALVDEFFLLDQLCVLAVCVVNWQSMHHGS